MEGALYVAFTKHSEPSAYGFPSQISNGNSSSKEKIGMWIVSAPSVPKSTLSKEIQVGPVSRVEIPPSKESLGFGLLSSLL